MQTFILFIYQLLPIYNILLKNNFLYIIIYSYILYNLREVLFIIKCVFKSTYLGEIRKISHF